jgi:hypothetical protein
MARSLRKITFAALLVAALPALGGYQWSRAHGTTSRGVKYSQCITTSGTEEGPLGPNDGLDLTAMKEINVTVRAESLMSSGGVLQAYLQDSSGTWKRVADGSLDLAVARCTTVAFVGVPVPDRGRIAYLPSGLGQPVTIELVGLLVPKR